MSPRTAVLIHGCHLQADLDGRPWEEIVWGCSEGETPTLSGRGTMGIKIAVENGAELLIFSTGASERNGVKEGEFTQVKAFEFAASGSLADALEWPGSDSVISEFLRDQSETDLESQNTSEECERNFRLCAERGIERVILVSSPWHIQRCHTEALKVAQGMRDADETVPEIVAMASYGSTEGIVILEPPHRGDRPKTRWHELARRFFKVAERDRSVFEQMLEKLFVSYGA